MANKSKLYNIEKMYGKDLNVTVTNAPPNIINNNSKRFIKNSLLISSSQSENGNEDDGYPSIFAIDYEGNSLQLTYAINQGSGLYINEYSHLGLNIDKRTIQENESTLFVDTDSLNKCGVGEFGIVKVEENIEKLNDIFPKSSYISVNDTGTLYLADSFYNYMWKYVKDEIIKAIQPLIPKNFSGYLIKGIRFSIPPKIVDGREVKYYINGSNEHIYESNSTNINSNGIIYNFGFYYTSGENISTSINVNDPENNLMVINNSPIPTITQASNYYNVITYGHEFEVNDDENSIPPFRIVFPPNFYRSGNSFIRKEHTLAVTINGESENSEWTNRKLYFHFSQEPGDYKIMIQDPSINISDLINGGKIELKFIYENFPIDVDKSIKNLVKYNLSLIWDKNGNALELWSAENFDLNNQTSQEFIASWSALEKNGLTDLLNPKITTEDNSDYKISNIYQAKKYTLRISVLNTLNNSEISKWDYDFTVTYKTDKPSSEAQSTIRNIYLSEVCIGNDDSYLVVDDIPETGTIGLEWVYSNDQIQTRGRKGVNNIHGEKIDRINSLFTRKYNDRMTLLFDFQYKDEDINGLSDEIYDLVFNEDSFNVKLQLIDKKGNIVNKTINDNGEESEDITRYSKSVKNPNDDILIDISDISVNSKNKNIKITFRKIIDPEIFINCITNDSSADDNYYNYVYMNIIIGNYYINTQSFTVKVDVDSLVMNTIPYSFEGGIVDIGQVFYLNYDIDHLMELYGTKVHVLNSALGNNDKYKLEILNNFEGYNKFGTDPNDPRFKETVDNENNYEIEINTDNSGYLYSLTFNDNSVGKKYSLLLKIINRITEEDIYLKYIQFESNMLECELPGFRISNTNYHYIYLATEYNPYNDQNNYKTLINYDNKSLIVNSGGEPNVDITTNFQDYLSNYMTNGLDIQNDCITFVDNDDKMLYYIVDKKYRIDSDNSPLLIISFGNAQQFIDIRPDYLTEDITGQNTLQMSTLYSNDDNNGLYNLIQQSSLYKNGKKLVNVYPAGYQKNSDGYSVDEGDAPQQLADSYKYNQEILQVTVILPLTIIPSEALQLWLYQAVKNYEYYNDIDFNYGENNGEIEINDINFNINKLSYILGNIFTDLLSNVLNDTIITALRDSAITYLYSNYTIDTDNQKIYFEGSYDLPVEVCINGNSYYYGSSMTMSLMYNDGGSGGIEIEKNEDDKDVILSLKIDGKDTEITVKYDYDAANNSRVISDTGRSSISVYKCKFIEQRFELEGFDSYFVESTGATIDFNNLTYDDGDGDPENDIKLTDLIYYLDYRTLYPGKTNLKDPGFKWSRNVCYVKDGTTTVDDGLPILENPNNVEDINISSDNSNVTVDGTTITISSISSGDKIKITADKQSEPEATGNWYGKQDSFYIIGYAEGSKLDAQFSWSIQEIEYDYKHSENLQQVILNNEYHEPVKYTLVIVETENNTEALYSGDNGYSAGEGGSISINPDTGELIGFNIKIESTGIKIKVRAYIGDDNTYYNQKEADYEIKIKSESREFR